MNLSLTSLKTYTLETHKPLLVCFSFSTFHKGMTNNNNNTYDVYVYYVPDTVLCLPHVLTHLIITTIL